MLSAPALAQAPEVFVDSCPRILLFNRNNSASFEATWIDVPDPRFHGMGWYHSIRVTLTLKKGVDKPDGSNLPAATAISFALLGGERPGILLVGRAAHWLCEEDAPIGNAPTLKPEHRLVGLK